MKTVTLQILAEDIKTTDYSNPKDCAMTRALRRAGLYMHEGGGYIYYDSYSGGSKVCITPAELNASVLSMYAFIDIKNNGGELQTWHIKGLNIVPTEPKDFTFEFTYSPKYEPIR